MQISNESSVSQSSFKPGIIRVFYLLTFGFTLAVYIGLSFLLWLRWTDQPIYFDQQGFTDLLLIFFFGIIAFIWFVLYGVYLSVVRPLYQTFFVIDSVLSSQLLEGDIKTTRQSIKALRDYIRGSVSTLGNSYRGDQKISMETEKYVKQIQQMSDQNRRLEESKQRLSVLVNDLERQQNQISLEKAKSESIINSIPNGVVASSRDGNIFLANTEVQRMLGFSENELFGKFLGKVLPLCDPDGEVSVCEELPTQKALRGEISSYEFEFLRPDTKQRILVENTASPIVLNEQIIGAVDIFRDVTKEREVERAQKEFVSLASHQLRTPITSISWNAELLMAEEELPESIRLSVEDIYRENKRMQKLVNAILSVSRIDLGTLKFVVDTIKLPQFLENIVHGFEPDLKKKKIQIDVSIDKTVDKVVNDPTHLDIVVGNLISNAIKYSPENSQISLRVIDCQDGFIQIEVEDIGMGIPVGEQSQIFGRLFRASNARERETDGNGLGLYLVKKLTEAMGGMVWFRSQEGKGSTFFVRIPQEVSTDVFESDVI